MLGGPNPLAAYMASVHSDANDGIAMGSSAASRASQAAITAAGHKRKRPPDPATSTSAATSTTSADADTNSTMSPVDFVKQIYAQHGLALGTTRDKPFFLKVTPDMVAAYDKDILKAVRDKDLAKLRQMHADGRNLNCCNRYGESLIHMACRNGLTDIVEFLIGTADVTLYVCDDFGRTPLHDACWSVHPNLDLMDCCLRHAPDLIGLADVRGHTPFAYARKAHWKAWVDFLEPRRGLLIGHVVRPADEPAEKRQKKDPEDNLQQEAAAANNFNLPGGGGKLTVG